MTLLDALTQAAAHLQEAEDAVRLAGEAVRALVATPRDGSEEANPELPYARQLELLEGKALEIVGALREGRTEKA